MQIVWRHAYLECGAKFLHALLIAIGRFHWRPQISGNHREKLILDFHNPIYRLWKYRIYKLKQIC